jgi:hypothetical protein
MTVSKYRFKKEFATSEVILHGATTQSVTAKNLTDALAEKLINSRNAHILEPNPDYVAEPKTKAEPKHPAPEHAPERNHDKTTKIADPLAETMANDEGPKPVVKTAKAKSAKK